LEVQYWFAKYQKVENHCSQQLTAIPFSLAKQEIEPKQYIGLKKLCSSDKNYINSDLVLSS